MSSLLKGKVIVLGVTGSIAAYKACEIASELARAEARVEVIMTRSATEFVSPLTFRNLTGRAVVTDMFELASEYSVEHVALAKAASVVVVAPATANVIAKIACGIADDMLTTTVLATRAPLVLAPAMDADMFQNEVTQENLAKLRSRGATIVGPAHGRLASGMTGPGRLSDIREIVDTIKLVLGKTGDLAGKRVLVTAGGTQEPVDPVRYVGNRSSGKMGYAVAEAARDRGAVVTLVSAPTGLPRPVGVEVVDVATADEMFQAVKDKVAGSDALVMAAAVADYRPSAARQSKIKRRQAKLTLELEATPDILGGVDGDFVRVGFAAETEDLVVNARKKLKAKRLDLIVANDVSLAESGFGADTNKVAIVDRQGHVEELPVLPKYEVAWQILDRVVEVLSDRLPASTSRVPVT